MSDLLLMVPLSYRLSDNTLPVTMQVRVHQLSNELEDLFRQWRPAFRKVAWPPDFGKPGNGPVTTLEHPDDR